MYLNLLRVPIFTALSENQSICFLYVFHIDSSCILRSKICLISLVISKLDVQKIGEKFYIIQYDHCIYHSI